MRLLTVRPTGWASGVACTIFLWERQLMQALHAHAHLLLYLFAKKKRKQKRKLKKYWIINQTTFEF